LAHHRLDRAHCNLRTGMQFSAGGTNYRLSGRIGDGAAGIVRKATNLRTDESVAVKFLAPDPKYIDKQAFDDVEHRFRREGQRGIGLEHEHLVKIIAYEDNIGGLAFKSGTVVNPFIVMEHVSGLTLESMIKNLEKRDDVNATINGTTLLIACRVADALRYLHERRIVHRDVKPANIFLSSTQMDTTPTTIKIGDFGVTKWGDFLAAAATGTLTVTFHQGLGTLKYMSPEQAVNPKEVSVRSDMFSFGITLFELFSGQILPSPHHIFQVMTARQSRSTTIARLRGLGVICSYDEAAVFDLVLDMFLTRANGRPSSRNVHGSMEFFLENMPAT